MSACGRKIGLVCGLLTLPLLATSWGGGGDGPKGPAQGLAAHFPQQAVLFDGSTEASSTLLMAFSHEGYLIDLGEGGYTCPEGYGVAEGGLFTATLQTSGVLRLTHAFVEGLPLQRISGTYIA